MRLFRRKVKKKNVPLPAYKSKPCTLQQITSEILVIGKKEIRFQKDEYLS